MTHAEQIATQLNVKPSQVTAVINLLDEGNTVPFIARYRKEMTGSLDNVGPKVGDISDVEIQKIKAEHGRIGLGWVK
jgi:transcriptional accessory protein Tex/SPT6